MNHESHQLLKEAVAKAGLLKRVGGFFKNWGKGVKGAFRPSAQEQLSQQGLAIGKKMMESSARGSAAYKTGSRLMAANSKVLAKAKGMRIGGINPLSASATKKVLLGGAGLYALNSFIPEAPQGPTSNYKLEMRDGVPTTANGMYTGRNAVAQHALRYVPIGTKLEDTTNFSQAWVKEMEKNPQAIKAMEEAGRPILTSKRPDQIPGMKNYPGLWDSLKPHVNKTTADITGFKPRSGI